MRWSTVATNASAGATAGCAARGGSVPAGRTGRPPPPRSTPSPGSGRPRCGRTTTTRCGSTRPRFGRSESTTPTGCCTSGRRGGFRCLRPSALERSQALRDGMREANARGVIGVHDFQAHGGRELWQRYDADRRLTLRVADERAAGRPGRRPRRRDSHRLRQRAAALRSREGVHGRHAGFAHGLDAGRLRRAAAVRGRAGDRDHARPLRAACRWPRTRSATAPTGPP